MRKYGTQAMLVNDATGEEYPLRAWKSSIGRSESNDIVINDPAMSRHHAELTEENGRYYITDCGSSNGVVVDGQRIPSGQSIPLRPNGELILAKRVYLRLCVDPADEPAAIAGGDGGTMLLQEDWDECTSVMNTNDWDECTSVMNESDWGMNRAIPNDNDWDDRVSALNGSEWNENTSVLRQENDWDTGMSILSEDEWNEGTSVLKEGTEHRSGAGQQKNQLHDTVPGLQGTQQVPGPVAPPKKKLSTFAKVAIYGVAVLIMAAIMAAMGGAIGAIPMMLLWSVFIGGAAALIRALEGTDKQNGSKDSSWNQQGPAK